MKIVTHNSYFHTDDLLAVATLLLKFPGSEVIRSRDEKFIESADIVVDTGEIYDAEKFRFDHHQPGGAGVRANGIPYASFGLVWKAFGEELAGGLDPAKVIEERLVMSVDASDNGVDLYSTNFEGVKEYSVGDYFNTFSYGAETMEEFDKAFFAALPLVQDFLKKEMAFAQYLVTGWNEVRRIYAESENKKIVVLPAHLPWKRVLIPSEALFVLSPRPNGQWSAKAVDRNLNTYGLKKPFPSSWAGLSGEALRNVTEVKDAVFCHNNLFLAVAESKEGALKLAEKALNA